MLGLLVTPLLLVLAAAAVGLVAPSGELAQRSDLILAAPWLRRPVGRALAASVRVLRDPSALGGGAPGLPWMLRCGSRSGPSSRRGYA